MKNNTVFILLAGGKSQRMGVAKGLLKYKHTFWILEQLHRISKTTISKVYIGLGYNYQHYFNAIPWFKNAVHKSVFFKNLEVKIVINKYPEFGAFSTLQATLEQLQTTCNVLVNPVDVPLLNTIELNAIIATKNTIVVPVFKGKNGHPIQLSFHFWQQLLTLKITDKNSRLDLQIKKTDSTKISAITVNDCSIIKNLNTKKAWTSFLNETN